MLIGGDARSLPIRSGSIQCVVTSPPYHGLRNYGVAGQIGLEATVEQYVAALVEVFREVRRVMRDDATCWLNLGDAFNAKQLVGLPWRVAFALQADGWWLRSDIVWAKPNPMPESITDRPTKAHEYLFLLAKRERYYYDAEAVKEPDAFTDHPRSILHKPEPTGGLMSPHRGIRKAEGRNGQGRNRRTVWTIATEPYPEAHFATFPEKLVEPCILAGTSERGACPACGAPWERIVAKSGGTIGQSWHDHEADGVRGQRIADQDASHGRNGREPYKVETTGWSPSCDCPAADPVPCRVLDPFSGSGTTVAVAERLGRVGVGVELKDEYRRLARRRTVQAGLL